jgi:AMP phosphorylase
MKFRVKKIDMETDGAYVIVLNEFKAIASGIHAGDRVKLERGDNSIIAITNLSDVSIASHEIGVFHEVAKMMNLKGGETIKLSLVPRPASIDFIKKKLEGKRLNEFEIFSIIEDVVCNRLSNTELSAFVTACYTVGLNMNETYYLTKAVVETGDILSLETRPVLDKHCLGGIPGNRTTMVVVPIIAAAGYTIPKTSSRSITSPAGTADTMEVLTNVNLSVDQMKEVVLKTGACIAFGGSVNLAAADDKLIKVRHPLHLDPESLMLASIMAKKAAVSSTHILIDIPVGPEAKTKTKKEAKRLAQNFKKIGKKFKQKVKVIFTDGSQPIGNGIGPILEAIDVLKVLKQTDDRPIDLENKAIHLASEMLAMVGKKNPKAECSEILRSGKAYEKMKEIIAAQGGDPEISEDDLKPAKVTKSIFSEKDGKVIYISNKRIARLGLSCGAPVDKDAGIYLWKHVGDLVKKGDKIITFYTKSEDRMNHITKLYGKILPIKID